MTLQARNISFGYENSFVLKDIEFSVKGGDFVALIGPNGSGKTTLLKVLLGALSPREGEVWLEGNPLGSYSLKELGKAIAYVSQEPFHGFPLTVQELVSLGRYPYSSRFKREVNGEEVVGDALRLTDSLPLKDKNFTTLSGGEKQKVLIARALAQATPLLLMDEPTVHLDINLQLQILGILKRTCTERGATVLAVLHDLNQVSLFADKVLLLKGGVMQGFGSVEKVFHEKMIEEVFGVKVVAIRDADRGTRYFFPKGTSL